MMAALLQLCRLYYAVPMALTYALTLYYALGGRMEGRWLGAAVTTAAVALVVAAAYVLNDVCDLAVDRLNAPHRPIAAGRVSRRAAAVWGAGLMVAGLAAAAAAARPIFFLVLAAVAATLVLYDLVSKRLGVGKPLLVAVLMTSLYPLAYAQAGGAEGPRAAALPVFAAWMFLTAFGYEVLKDIRDIPGDCAAATGPMQVQRRPRLWRGLAGGVVLSAAMLLLVPAGLGCGWVYLVGAVAAILAAALSVFLPVQRALAAIYVECFLVGVAATLDPLILGF
jgi:geranylgeranylglycerol-phosphate geranylgeranyltransferase